VDINEWLKFWYHFTGWRRFAGGRSDYVPISDENYSEILRTIVILALFIALTALMATMCLDSVVGRLWPSKPSVPKDKGEVREGISATASILGPIERRN
jgi:hypothetical protein